jgi:bleomycin hydrolase
MLRKLTTAFLFIVSFAIANAQTQEQFFDAKTIAVTPVKNQAMTGTCWCFGGTSLLESQFLKSGSAGLDLSEMYFVRNIYLEKAKNYILRQGHAQFGEGGLGHDVIHAIATYGAIPLSVYSGLVNGQKQYDHVAMAANLKSYLDSVLKTTPIANNWIERYVQILDDGIGVPPATFQYNGKEYTPKTFAADVLKFNDADYVNIASFTDHPYYEPFILQVPDDFSNGDYYNLPLSEMIQAAKYAVNSGYSLLWDTDVSNNGFMQDKGLALLLDDKTKYNTDSIKADMPEAGWNPNIRQQLYENLTTQDDHLMHISGIEKSKGGKDFFIVKNSWGDVGPYQGYLNASEAYFAINTISLVIPKAALSKELLAKLKIK